MELVVKVDAVTEVWTVISDVTDRVFETVAGPAMVAGPRTSKLFAIM